MGIDEICKNCGHGKLEHNPPSDWESEEDTFCFHKGCTCSKFEPLEEGDTPNIIGGIDE